MAIKSAYRENPPSKLPRRISGSLRKAPRRLIDKTDPDSTVAAIDAAIPTDEATLASKQLADLRESEELQRQYAMHSAVQMSQRARRRVQFLQSQGLTKTEAEWFDLREDIMSSMSNQQLASEAAAEARAAGIERDSPEFFQAVEEGFAKRLQAAEQPAPAPAFFAPRPAPSPAPAAPDRSGMYSAPVSRGTPSGETGQRPVRTIRLTAEEQEYARSPALRCRICATEAKLAQAKAAGDYGSGDDFLSVGTPVPCRLARVGSSQRPRRRIRAPMADDSELTEEELAQSTAHGAG
jgi:hypothetical protein